MTIVIRSKSTGLFTRNKERVEKFTDDCGDYELAMQHICLMIACERDVTIKVMTPQRQEADELLEAIGTCSVGRVCADG